MKTNNSFNIIVDKCVLNKVKNIKYLSVIIVHKLSWIEHISYVKKKKKGIGILYKARIVLEKSDLLNLYYSYIYIYISISNLLYSNLGLCCKITYEPIISSTQENHKDYYIFSLCFPYAIIISRSFDLTIRKVSSLSYSSNYVQNVKWFNSQNNG